MQTGQVRLRRWWRAGRQAGVLLAAMPLTLLGLLLPAEAAGAATPAVRRVALASAAGPGAGSDRAPGEIALLGVCCAVLIALVAVVIRRARVRGWHPGRALVGTVRTGRREGTEPEAVADDDDITGGFRWRPRAGMLVPAAAVLLVAGGLGAAVVFGGSGHGTAGRGSTAPAANPVPGQPQTSAAPTATSPRPGKQSAKGARGAASPGPGQSPSHGGAAAANGSGSASSGPSGSSGSTGSGPSGPGNPPVTTSPPSPGVLDGVPSSQVPCTASSDAVSTCSFTFGAAGGPVNYTVSEPASEQSDFAIAITNASGTLQSGSTAAITVTVTPEGVNNNPESPPTWSYVTVNPGGMTVSLDASLPCWACE